jgi:hypothetical protein
MVTSKTKMWKNAIETISRKSKKSGKIREKVNFFWGGGCKTTHCIIGKGKKTQFLIINAIMVSEIIFSK